MLPRQQVNSVKVDLNNKILKDSHQNKAKEWNPEKFGKNVKNHALQPQVAKRASTSHGNHNNPHLIKQASIDVDYSYNNRQMVPPENQLKKFPNYQQQSTTNTRNKNSMANLSTNMSPNFERENKMYNHPSEQPNIRTFNPPDMNFNKDNAGSHLGLSNSIVTTNNMNNLPQAQTYDRDDFTMNNNMMKMNNINVPPYNGKFGDNLPNLSPIPLSNPQPMSNNLN